LESRCRRCRGTGFEIVSNPEGETKAVRCACTETGADTRLLVAARIPKRYAHCDLEGFEPQNRILEKARDAARKWVDRWPDIEEGHGLLFHGNPGAGKTHLAVGILRDLVTRKNARGLFFEQRELLKTLQGTFEPGSVRSESDVLGPVHGAEILVLDDVGAGRTTEWARDVLHEIIAHRYNNRLSLILTTNCPLTDDSRSKNKQGGVLGVLTLQDKLGDALMSRLYEMCRFVPVEGGMENRKEKDYRRGVLNSQIERY
jgi:DNA replication protein DnaC